MMKCPNCGVEVESGMKFCGECGTPIPQTKECPVCHAQWLLTAKFCGECGYNFNAAKASGAVIGDKNVIAGDVSIDNSKHVVNNTSNVVNNVVHQDETRRLVKCCVCLREIGITKAYVCSECHEKVCRDHYVQKDGLCSACAEKLGAQKRERFGARRELELKWMSRWAHCDYEQGTHRRAVLGVDFTGTEPIGALLVNGQPVIIPADNEFPDDYRSANCSDELKLAFELHAMRDAARRAYGVCVRQVVVADCVGTDLERCCLYRRAAQLINLEAKRIVLGSVVAALVDVAVWSETPSVGAHIVVTTKGYSVSIVISEYGVYEVVASRGETCREDELINKIALEYKDCCDELRWSGSGGENGVRRVEKVYLVGELSDVAWLREKVSELTGFRVEDLHSANLAVAYGVAIQGGILDGTIPNRMVLDCISTAFGIELDDGSFLPVIERETTIPTKVCRRVNVSPSQCAGLSVNVYQGVNGLAEANRFIGCIRLDGPLMASHADITIDCDANAVLTVSVECGDVSRKQTLPDYSKPRCLEGLPRMS